MIWKIIRTESTDTRRSDLAWDHSIPDGYIVRVEGELPDGRRAGHVQHVSRETWEHFGQERCEQMVRDSALQQFAELLHSA